MSPKSIGEAWPRGRWDFSAQPSLQASLFVAGAAYLALPTCCLEHL